MPKESAAAKGSHTAWRAVEKGNFTNAVHQFKVQCVKFVCFV